MLEQPLSFKLIMLFLFLVGCGVKGAPVPKAQAIPSGVEADYPELNLPPASLSGK